MNYILLPIMGIWEQFIAGRFEMLKQNLLLGCCHRPDSPPCKASLRLIYTLWIQEVHDSILEMPWSLP